MPHMLTCPKCNDRRMVPGGFAGKTLRCLRCRTILGNEPVAATPVLIATKPRRARFLLVGLAVLLLLAGAVAACLAYFRAVPTDFTDPDGIFSVRFPDQPESETVAVARPEVLVWGERTYHARAGGLDYLVAVLDGVNIGNREVGPGLRDHFNDAVTAIAIANVNGEKVGQRPAIHQGHVARETLYFHRDDGRLTASRVIVGQNYVVRIEVTGNVGDRSKAYSFLDQSGAFFDQVTLGPAFGPAILHDLATIAASDLSAEYQADATAADAKYRDQWMRIAGRVRAVLKGGAEVEIDGGPFGFVFTLQVAAPKQYGPGQEVTLFGKCGGLESPAGPIRRVRFAGRNWSDKPPGSPSLR